MMLIGFISDTHGRLDPLAYNALAECEHIIHAGDIGNPEILTELETLAPVTAVLGNNDFYEYGSHVQRFAQPLVDGVGFLVAHFPEDVRISSFGSRALAPGDPIPSVCVHGHTHMPRLDFGKKARPAAFVINPGSATWPRGGYPKTIAKMLVDTGRIIGIRIEDLEGNPVLWAGEKS